MNLVYTGRDVLQIKLPDICHGSVGKNLLNPPLLLVRIVKIDLDRTISRPVNVLIYPLHKIILGLRRQDCKGCIGPPFFGPSIYVNIQ